MEDLSEELSPERPGLQVFSGSLCMNDRLVSSDGMERIRVQMVKLISPGEFYLTMNHMDGEYVALEEKMQQYFNHLVPIGFTLKSRTPRKWELDDPCAIKVGNKWKRGVVVEEPYVEDHDRSLWMVTVKLVDEVKEISVPTSELVPVPLKFRRLIDRVNRCCLGGIQPVGPSWTESAVRKFNDFVRRNSTLYILRMKNDRPHGDISVMCVELLSLKKGAETPDTESWISLNDQLCMKGFARTDVFISQRKYHEDTGSGRRQVCNLMEDEMEVLAYLFKETFKPHTGRRIDVGQSKTKWFPADPLGRDVISGKVTFVGENCDIYIQNSDNITMHMLKTINDEVQEVCEQSHPSDIFWEVGDICLARFDLDNQWYRGEIVKDPVEGYHVVRFVDYGNIEYIKNEDLRLATGLTMRPLQVHVCYFDNLMPFSPPQWKQLPLELIHRMLVDKMCQVELRRLRSGFLGIVNLYLPDNTNALERIMSEGLGQYINPPPGFVENNGYAMAWYDKDATDQVSKFIFWRDIFKKDGKELEKSFKLLKIPNDVDSFSVEIPAMAHPDLFLLKVCDSSNDQLKIQTEAFVDLQTTLQEEAENLPYCNPSDTFKTCISKYDGFWYRAAVLKSLSNTVTIQYVDYGNIEEKSVEKLKEMKDLWYTVPAHAIPCCIYGYKYSGKFPPGDVMQVLQRRFSAQSNIVATIKKRRAKNLEVELRNEFGALLYQDFIDTNIYVPR